MYCLTSELNRGAPDELVSLSWLVWTSWTDKKVSTNYTVHCYKTEGEIPVHTHDDAGRQRSTTGKYFR
jgi:hypothetical protein